MDPNRTTAALTAAIAAGLAVNTVDTTPGKTILAGLIAAGITYWLTGARR